MSRLTNADYENVLDLIEAVYRTPNVSGVLRLRCTSPCGYNPVDILSSYRATFPNSTLTDNQVNDLLVRGARSGVFSKSCSTATSSDVSECGVGSPVYHVNNNMVRANMKNSVYALAFNGPPVPRVVPCDESTNGDINSSIACVSATGGNGNASGWIC